MPRYEAAFTYGGDLQIGPTGDWVILADTPENPAATIQRLIQLINTNAVETVYNSLGNSVVLRPDDLFNPNYGLSIPRLLGSTPTTAVLNEIKARLLAAFLSDDGIAQTPAPSVSVYVSGKNIVVDDITVYDLGGNAIPIPTQTLAPFGVQS